VLRGEREPELTLLWPETGAKSPVPEPPVERTQGALAEVALPGEGKLAASIKKAPHPCGACTGSSAAPGAIFWP
jgi:hypothetical protein